MPSRESTGSADLGSLLRDRREELGLTQKEVAFGANITERQLRRLELNESTPRLANLANLASALDLDPAALVRAAQ